MSDSTPLSEPLWVTAKTYDFYQALRFLSNTQRETQWFRRADIGRLAASYAGYAFINQTAVNVSEILERERVLLIDEKTQINHTDARYIRLLADHREVRLKTAEDNRRKFLGRTSKPQKVFEDFAGTILDFKFYTEDRHLNFRRALAVAARLYQRLDGRRQRQVKRRRGSAGDPGTR